MIIKLLLSTSMVLSLAACSGGASGGGSGQSNVDPLPNGAAVYAPTMSGDNVIPVTVSCGYMNMPCVSVTICKPGTSFCVVVDKILLDTGSSGLRVFSSKISTLNLSSETSSLDGGELAKITNFADGTCHWGPVKIADLKLGNEVASNNRIQVIYQGTYATIPADSQCNNPETDPVAAEYNGILGVGVRDQDCGSTCVAATNNGSYYSCTSGTCTGSTASLTQQVRNPVAMLSAIAGIDDSNGSALVLPSIPTTGAISASGYLILGIGTRTNNTPDGTVKMFKTDSNGFFTTSYNSRSYTAFIDSGSNGLYFPPTSSSTPICSGSVFYCPDSTVSLSATIRGTNTSMTQAISFNVVNTYAAYYSDNYASNTGGYLTMSGSYVFDWGLPFFFGRTVYTGINGKSTTINGTSSLTSSFYAF